MGSATEDGAAVLPCYEEVRSPYSSVMASLLRHLEGGVRWVPHPTKIPFGSASGLMYRTGAQSKRELKRGLLENRWVILQLPGRCDLVRPRDYQAKSELVPVQVVSEARDIWVFKGEAYSALAGLTCGDVLALINKQENLRRRQLDNAHALQAMTEARPQSRQPLTKDVKLAVWQRDGGRCVACGKNENLEFDHLIPFSKGGANTVRNIQLLCETCNRSKGASFEH